MGISTFTEQYPPVFLSAGSRPALCMAKEKCVMKTNDKGEGHRRPSAAATSPNDGVTAVPKERSQFRALIVTNPNYFGN